MTTLPDSADVTVMSAAVLAAIEVPDQNQCHHDQNQGALIGQQFTQTHSVHLTTQIVLRDTHHTMFPGVWV